MKSNKRDLTTGSVAKKITGLTVPMMFGIISMVAFNLVDTFFVGKLGSLQLAALSFTFPVILVIFSIIQGLGIGATAIISRSIGKNDKEKAARETTDSLTLSLAVSGFFIVIGLLTVEPTFRMLGASDEIMPYVTDYMTIWYFTLFVVTIPFVGNSAIRSTGDSLTPSLIMVFAVVINAILDPLLIFGYGPFPELGLKGAALATAISRAITMVVSLLILYYREKLIVLKMPSRTALFASWKTILWIGLPSGLSRLITPIFTGLVTATLAKYGEHAVAGYGVGTRLEFLAMSLLIALSASIGPFTGQNYGAGNIDRISAGVKFSSFFSLLWGVLASILLYFFAHQIGSIFSDDPNVIAATGLYLSIVPIAFGFQGIVQIVNSNINTLSKPFSASSIIAIQMLVIGIPALYLGEYLFGIKGIYGGIAITYFLGGVLSIAWNSNVMKKLKCQYAKVS